MYVKYGAVNITNSPGVHYLLPNTTFIPNINITLPPEHWITGWKAKLYGCIDESHIEVSYIVTYMNMQSKSVYNS